MLLTIYPERSFLSWLLDLFQPHKHENHEVATQISVATDRAREVRELADQAVDNWNETERHIHRSLSWEDMLPERPQKVT